MACLAGNGQVIRSKRVSNAYAAPSLVLGFGIGGSLGLLGGGGSILTVPALVYLIGQTPQIAVTTSLAIVGANSALGAFFHRSQGTLNWRVALVFGGTGMLFSYLAAGISKQVSPNVLMVAFALLMLVVGTILVRQKPAAVKLKLADDASNDLKLWKILLGGAAVGLLTGILGVGGGFLNRSSAGHARTHVQCIRRWVHLWWSLP